MITPLRINADYNWLLTSPELIDTTNLRSHFDLDTSDIDSILSHAISPPIQRFDITYRRLGHYFEDLFFLSIQNNDHYELIERNKQIHIDRKTIGEFDALIQSVADGRKVHAELAVKFYLQRGIGSELADWIGPGLRDRLDIKYQRMMAHQLQLSRRLIESDDNNLRQLTIDQVALLTRGSLYYHYKQYIEQHFVYPEQISPDHSKGFWILAEDFATVMSDGKHLSWYDLIKPYWFSAVTVDDLQLLEPFHMNSFSGAKQVVAMSAEQEVMRGFVVTRDWCKKANISSEIFCL